MHPITKIMSKIKKKKQTKINKLKCFDHVRLIIFRFLMYYFLFTHDTTRLGYRITEDKNATE